MHRFAFALGDIIADIKINQALIPIHKIGEDIVVQMEAVEIPK